MPPLCGKRSCHSLLMALLQQLHLLLQQCRLLLFAQHLLRSLPQACSSCLLLRSKQARLLLCRTGLLLRCHRCHSSSLVPPHRCIQLPPRGSMLLCCDHQLLLGIHHGLLHVLCMASCGLCSCLQLRHLRPGKLLLLLMPLQLLAGLLEPHKHRGLLAAVASRKFLCSALHSLAPLLYTHGCYGLPLGHSMRCSTSTRCGRNSLLALLLPPAQLLLGLGTVGIRCRLLLHSCMHRRCCRLLVC